MGVIQTNVGPRGTRLPRLENEGKDIAPGNPIAVIALLVTTLRTYFSYESQERLPWLWDADLRPDDLEDGGVPIEENGHARKILIEPAFNVHKSSRNYRPAIYVDRGGARPLKMAVNNFVGQNFHSGRKAYHCFYEMGISIECHSDVAAESCTIGDTVSDFFLATRDVFRETIGLHELSEPLLGETRPSKTDNEYWVTPVQFSVQYDKRWGTKPIAPLAREIELRLREADNPDEIYMSLIERSDGIPEE
jgi:hypothetical protein